MENENEGFKRDIALARERYRDSLEEEKQKKEISDLQSKISTLDKEKARHFEEISNLKCRIKETEATVFRRDACMHSQQTILEAKTEALKVKEAIMSDMSKEINKAAEYLINKKTGK